MNTLEHEGYTFTAANLDEVEVNAFIALNNNSAYNHKCLLKDIVSSVSKLTSAPNEEWFYKNETSYSSKRRKRLTCLTMLHLFNESGYLSVPRYNPIEFYSGVHTRDSLIKSNIVLAISQSTISNDIDSDFFKNSPQDNSAKVTTNIVRAIANYTIRSRGIYFAPIPIVITTEVELAEKNIEFINNYTPEVEEL